MLEQLVSHNGVGSPRYMSEVLELPKKHTKIDHKKVPGSKSSPKPDIKRKGPFQIPEDRQERPKKNRGPGRTSSLASKPINPKQYIESP